MSDTDRLLYGAIFSIVVCVIALALGYGRVVSAHYPLTVGQRKLWAYYVLFVVGLPIIGELFLAMSFWLMPIKVSGAVAIILLVAWMVAAFYIVRRMSRPGGRLNRDGSTS